VPVDDVVARGKSRPVNARAQGPLFPRWLLGVLGAIAILWGIYELRAVLTPVFFAFLIAYALDPLVDRLEAWKLPRALAIVVLLAVFGGLVFLFLILVMPGVVREMATFGAELPKIARALVRDWEPVLESYGIPVPHSLAEAAEQLGNDAEGMAQRAMGPAATVLEWIVGGTANAISAVVGLLVVPVFAFYLLYDFDRMMAALRELVPVRARDGVFEVFTEIDDVLGQFVRGQLLVMLCLAVLYAVGYSLVGVRLAIPIGIIAGLLAFIPYVGGAVALGLALLMCALSFQGWQQIGLVVIVYGAVQVLEGFVITPKIVGDSVGLSSVWVLFALMVGGEIFGFLGVLLAVPAAAVAKIFVVRGVDSYRSSSWFAETTGDTLVDAGEEDDADASLVDVLADADARLIVADGGDGGRPAERPVDPPADHGSTEDSAARAGGRTAHDASSKDTDARASDDRPGDASAEGTTDADDTTAHAATGDTRAPERKDDTTAPERTEDTTAPERTDDAGDDRAADDADPTSDESRPETNADEPDIDDERRS